LVGAAAPASLGFVFGAGTARGGREGGKKKKEVDIKKKGKKRTEPSS